MRFSGRAERGGTAAASAASSIRAYPLPEGATPINFFLMPVAITRRHMSASASALLSTRMRFCASTASLGRGELFPRIVDSQKRTKDRVEYHHRSVPDQWRVAGTP